MNVQRDVGPERDALPPPREIDLRGVAVALWRRKLLLLAFLAASGLLCLIFLQLQEQKYAVTYSVVAAEEESSESSVLGLASEFLGGAIAAGDSNKFVLFRSLLKSRRLAIALTSEHPEFLAYMGYREKPNTPIQWAKDAIKLILRMSTAQVKPYEFMYNYLIEQLRVDEDVETGILTVSITHTNSEFAAQFVHAVVETADQIIREENQEKAKVRVDYITQLLGQEMLNANQEALRQLLIQAEQELMVSTVDRFYVIQPVDPPQVPTLPSEPKPILAILAFGMLGIGLFVVTLIVMRSFGATIDDTAFGPLRERMAEYRRTRKWKLQIPHLAARKPPKPIVRREPR